MRQENYFTTKKNFSIILVSLIFITVFTLNPYKNLPSQIIYNGIFFVSAIFYILYLYTDFTMFYINKIDKLTITAFQEKLSIFALICGIISEITIMNFQPNIAVACLRYINTLVIGISIGIIDDWKFYYSKGKSK